MLRGIRWNAELVKWRRSWQRRTIEARRERLGEDLVTIPSPPCPQMLGLASCCPRNGDLSVTTDGAALIYAGGKAKEVDMASIKQERTLHDTGMMDSSKTASHADWDR